MKYGAWYSQHCTRKGAWQAIIPTLTIPIVISVYDSIHSNVEEADEQQRCWSEGVRNSGVKNHSKKQSLCMITQSKVLLEKRVMTALSYFRKLNSNNFLSIPIF